MTFDEIAHRRLVNQKLTSGAGSPGELSGWMGAIQAQDFTMVKWAFGIRLPGSTAETIEKAINDGEIIRTHVLRPTWHFVSAVNLLWMLELSSPRIRPSLKYRQDFLGLTPGILEKSKKTIKEALTGGKHLTREELITVLKAGGITTDNNSFSHQLLWAELNGLVCSGRMKGNKPTYTLITEWVPSVRDLPREESLGKLAAIYFTSHGPATVKDFAWWSGLSAADIRKALETADKELESVVADSTTYWQGKNFSSYEQDSNKAWLLPAFDEFIISYTDRSAVMTGVNHKKAVSDNGVFRPVIVINGQVTGLWKPVNRKDRITLETAFFKRPLKQMKVAVEEAALNYGTFLGKKTDVIFSEY